MEKQNPSSTNLETKAKILSLKRRTHALQENRILPTGIYQRMWFRRIFGFTDGCSWIIYRRMCPSVILIYRRNYQRIWLDILPMDIFVSKVIT